MYQMKEIGKRSLRTIIQHLDKKGIQGYKNCGGRVDDGAQTWENIASEIYTFMPTHYFKFKHILCEDAIETVEEVTVVDIGCGMGTVTHAFLEEILETYPDKRIVCIGGEPCEKRNELYDIAFSKYTNNLTYKCIRAFFPQDIEVLLTK